MNESQRRRTISTGSVFEENAGYSRAVCDGRWVFIAGTTGFDYETMQMSDDVVEQCRQTLKTIGKVLDEAGSSFQDVVRVNYIFPDSTDFEKCWPTLREVFGQVKPASTMFSAALADPRMKVEIEVTALKARQ